MRKRLTLVLFPGLLAACLCATHPALAGTVGDSSSSDPAVMDDGMDNLPPADLAGWFEDFDPSNEWTSSSNILTMESWLSDVEQASVDPSLFAALDGLGMDDSVSPALDSDIAPGDAPEPATLELLGGALAILGLYTLQRVRRCRNQG